MSGWGIALLERAERIVHPKRVAYTQIFDEHGPPLTPWDPTFVDRWLAREQVRVLTPEDFPLLEGLVEHDEAKITNVDGVDVTYDDERPINLREHFSPERDMDRKEMLRLMFRNAAWGGFHADES